MGTHAHKRKSSAPLRRYNTDPRPSVAQRGGTQHDDSESESSSIAAAPSSSDSESEEQPGGLAAEAEPLV